MDFLYAQSSTDSSFLSFLPFILMVMVIYFLMLRPQMKQQKERKKMLENLKKGDKIITSGGIYGTIAGFKGNNSIIRLNGQTISNDLTIDSDENGMSAGPITQSATVTVNGYWSIV